MSDDRSPLGEFYPAPDTTVGELEEIFEQLDLDVEFQNHRERGTVARLFRPQ